MSEYTVERSATMKASAHEVFDHLVHLSKWEGWSPWDELDPDMQKTFTGTDGEPGSGYSWKGNRKVGEGEMTITAAEAPNRLNADLNFMKPFDSKSKVQFDLQDSGESTTVTWHMTSEHNTFTRVMNVFGLMDRMIGRDFEKGLGKLRTLVEA